MEREIQFLAMNIVNQLFDLAEVPVEKRQDINDVTDNFVHRLLQPLLAEAHRLKAENDYLRSYALTSIFTGTLTADYSGPLLCGNCGKPGRDHGPLAECWPSHWVTLPTAARPDGEWCEGGTGCTHIDGSMPVPSGGDSLSGSSPTSLSERTFRPPAGTGTPSVASGEPNESGFSEKRQIDGGEDA